MSHLDPFQISGQKERLGQVGSTGRRKLSADFVATAWGDHFFVSQTRGFSMAVATSYPQNRLSFGAVEVAVLQARPAAARGTCRVGRGDFSRSSPVNHQPGPPDSSHYRRPWRRMRAPAMMFGAAWPRRLGASKIQPRKVSDSSPGKWRKMGPFHLVDLGGRVQWFYWLFRIFFDESSNLLMGYHPILSWILPGENCQWTSFLGAELLCLERAPGIYRTPSRWQRPLVSRPVFWSIGTPNIPKLWASLANLKTINLITSSSDNVGDWERYRADSFKVSVYFAYGLAQFTSKCWDWNQQM